VVRVFFALAQMKRMALVEMMCKGNGFFAES
jgi:hypothetical protein